MKIQIEDHAIERASERGVNENEIFSTLKTGIELPAKNNRLFKEKVFIYEKEWNGKYFKEKKVKVIYVVEAETIVVITVVVKFGMFSSIS
jgi:hypothetical protein